MPSPPLRTVPLPTPHPRADRPLALTPRVRDPDMRNARHVSMTDRHVDDTIKLVLTVARLGEMDLSGWWQSHGLDRAGAYVLRRSFPRTWRAAGLQLDIASAARRHSDALGARPTAIHLFSDHLPCRRWALAWLAEEKKSDGNELMESLAAWDRGAAVDALANWAGQPAYGEQIAEGLLLGRVTPAELADDEQAADIGRQLAAAYGGLERDFVAPYFDLAT